jgi:hypothetical protein
MGPRGGIMSAGSTTATEQCNADPGRFPETTDIGKWWQRGSMIETGMVMKFPQQT